MPAASLADQAASQWTVLVLSSAAFVVLVRLATRTWSLERRPILALATVCLMFATTYAGSLAGWDAGLTADMRRGIGFVLFPALIWFALVRMRRTRHAAQVVEAVIRNGGA